jgi:hypothetical protein
MSAVTERRWRMSRRVAAYCAALCCLVQIASTAVADAADEKQVIGWIESVALTSESVVMDAKVDTGADFSSVNAQAIRYFERDGRQWVEFSLTGGDGRTHLLQRPVERFARIKKKTGGYQERPVVVMELCMGERKRRTQVNLAQRGHFNYPLLLGRSFLAGHYLVDSASRHRLVPACR